MENATLTMSNTTDGIDFDKKNETETVSVSNEPVKYDRYFYIGIYGAIIAGIFIASLLRNFALVFWTMSSSGKLHNNLFMSVVRAPMNFFEKNSMGKFTSINLSESANA